MKNETVKETIETVESVDKFDSLLTKSNGSTKKKWFSFGFSVNRESQEVTTYEDLVKKVFEKITADEDIGIKINLNDNGKDQATKVLLYILKK